LPPNGSLLWFFLRRRIKGRKFPGRTQEIGGKEGT